jgi:hypothetical protein
LVYGKDEHGVHLLRRRSPDAPIEAGVLQSLVEGRPITGEVVSLRPRSEAPYVFDVKTELEAPNAPVASDGPSQVATDSYREGWDKIWGGKRARSN